MVSVAEFCDTWSSNLRVRYSLLPVGFANRGDNRVDKLFHKYGPISDPFKLVSHDQRAGDTFTLEGPYLISTHALGQPDSSLGRHVFVEALVKEGSAAYAVGYGAAEASQRNRRVRQILEPHLTFRIGECDARRRLERGRGSNLAAVSPLVEDSHEDGG